MRVLWISGLCPLPLTDGHRQRVYHLLRAVARQHPTTLLCQVRPEDAPHLAELSTLCQRVIAVPRPEGEGSSALHRAARRVRNVLTLSPTCFLPPALPAMHRELERLPGPEFDLALGSLYCAPLVLAAPARRRLLDDQNVESDLYRQLWQSEPFGPRKLSRFLDWLAVDRFERRHLPRADRITVCSERDRDTLRHRLPTLPPITVIPNGINLSHKPAQRRNGAANSPHPPEPLPPLPLTQGEAEGGLPLAPAPASAPSPANASLSASERGPGGEVLPPDEPPLAPSTALPPRIGGQGGDPASSFLAHPSSFAPGADPPHPSSLIPHPSEETLIFTGSMAYAPNIEAAEHLVRDLMPRIWAARPAVRLLLVGKDPDPRVRALASDRVTVTGTVPDPRPYLDRATLAVVPLRSGGGTRLKVLEAMAAGVPLVSTPLGAQGLDLTPGRHLLLADSPAEFAAAVLDLLTNPEKAQSLAHAARTQVEALYGWESIGTTFLTTLDHLTT